MQTTMSNQLPQYGGQTWAGEVNYIGMGKRVVYIWNYQPTTNSIAAYFFNPGTGQIDFVWSRSTQPTLSGFTILMDGREPLEVKSDQAFLVVQGQTTGLCLAVVSLPSLYQRPSCP